MSVDHILFDGRITSVQELEDLLHVGIATLCRLAVEKDCQFPPQLPEQEERILYSNSEMAAMCGVAPQTWCRWVRQGEAPQPIEINGLSRWPAKVIDKWMDKEIKASS